MVKPLRLHDKNQGNHDAFKVTTRPVKPALQTVKVALKYEEITRDVIGAAIAVLNQLKPGLDEKLYENALVIELTSRGHRVEQQREYPVHYRGRFVGKLIPDLIVDNLIIVDPKVAAAFNETHMSQMLGYLNITGLDVALLLNFKEAKLAWKRVVGRDAEQTDR